MSYAQIDLSGQQLSRVDFKEIAAQITVDPYQKSVSGNVRVKMEMFEPADSVFLDARNMIFENVLLNGKEVEFRNDNQRLWLISNFTPSAENIISFSYKAVPRQSMYFINWDIAEEVEVSRQVWTQGQGRFTSHWLPSFDNPGEKVIFNLTWNFPKEYTLVSNGSLINKTAVNNNLTQWEYTMHAPMSSYLVAMAAGKYDSGSITTGSGIPVTNYFEPKDREKAEPTYRHTKEIFDFLETEIGVAYPWQNYKQIPVQDFLYSGMENTGTTIFSNSFVVDGTGYNDINYVKVNAHELAHQWFGNYVTSVSDEHHWLQEGFATYYALLAERQVFGDDYYYWNLYQSAEELKALSDSGKGEALLSLKSSSLTYYQKGAWALHILREKVGDRAFKEAVQNYLNAHAFGNAGTDDLIREFEKASGQDLSDFVSGWLLQSAFQGTETLNSLKKSQFIRNYMEVAALRELPYQNKKEQLNRTLNFPVNDYIGQEVVYQLAGQTGPGVEALYKKAFESGNLYVRQAIASSIENIPPQLKGDFVSLLNDDSYFTVEYALLKLWMQYPEEAGRWIEKTANIEGFFNKNVRMLWLVLNLVSPQTAKNDLAVYYNELGSYTREYYPFEVRQNAFGYLYQLNAFDDENLTDLVKAGQHHNTRFRDYSRKLLAELLKQPEYIERYSQLKVNMSPRDETFLSARLKSK
ncbi:M1 family metallopeptidase [Antarcticibacterium arcticum]|uniref:Aminopeptidase N n=1 Tax=Antarcticibacterium arcticum TaxID=2585771 RepID=A0A5B8YL68_9FLAO|nr:M1 family metallopeptidase [Antarcticibacterium arcticum]QED37547.1 M1 family metallopeptidase [Antarcticibacterium arcticum]